MSDADAVRVLWVSNGLGPGGAERLLVTLAAELEDDEAFDIAAVYLLPHKDHLVGSLRAHGVEATCLATSRWDLRWLVRLRQRMRAVDVVHVHSPVVAAAARLLRLTMRRHRPRLVVTEHNSWSSHRLPTRLANRLTAGLEDVLIAVSEDVRSSMTERVRRGAEVVVHGVAVGALREAVRHRASTRAALNVDPEATLAVTVANLRHTKDHPSLLRAAQLVLAQRPDVLFVVAGQGPLEDDLRRQHSASGLGGSFRYLGYVEDVPDLVAASDLFVLSSRHEGLPIAVLEALALGIPVVSTDVGGIPTVVRHEVDGLLVPPERPDLLAEAILRMVDDDALCTSMQRSLAERDDLGIGPAAAVLRDHYRSALATEAGTDPRQR